MAQKIVSRDNVDIVVGTVGSNVVPVMQKICTDNNKPLIVPTAARNDSTRAQLSPADFPRLAFQLADDIAGRRVVVQAG